MNGTFRLKGRQFCVTLSCRKRGRQEVASGEVSINERLSASAADASLKPFQNEQAMHPVMFQIKPYDEPPIVQCDSGLWKLCSLLYCNLVFLIRIAGCERIITIVIFTHRGYLEKGQSARRHARKQMTLFTVLVCQMDLLKHS
jgi:hypothetical protein